MGFGGGGGGRGGGGKGGGDLEGRQEELDALRFARKNAGKGLAESPYLRFKVGDRVQCKTGMTEWSVGEIVQLYYVEPGRGDGPFPYQVQLDDGRLIFVPRDMPQLCRKVELAWWENLFVDQWRSDPSRGKNRAVLLRRLGEDKVVDQRDVHGNSALLLAAREGWADGVRELLELRANPNGACTGGRRPLHEAADGADAPEAREEAVRLLLAAGADPQFQDDNPEWKPEYLTESGRDHRTALHYSASSGLAGVARMLLQSTANPDAEDGERKRPLHLAIEEDATEVANLLIQAGADVNAGNLEIGLTSTPLIFCAYQNNLEIATKLIEARANLNAAGKQGMTALHVAARSRREKLVRLLLGARADATVQASGQTAADLAAVNGLTEIAALIRGAAVPAAEESGAASVKTEVAPQTIEDIDAKTRALLFMD